MTFLYAVLPSPCREWWKIYAAFLPPSLREGAKVPGDGNTKKRKHPLPLFYQKMMSMPTKMPTMAEKAGSLLWYIKMDWGRISPKTT